MSYQQLSPSNSCRPSMDNLVDMKFIVSDCLFSDKWIYRLISQGRFPKPIKMGRMSRWIASDYYKWRDGYIASSQLGFECSRTMAKKIREGDNVN